MSGNAMGNPYAKNGRNQVRLPTGQSAPSMDEEEILSSMYNRITPVDGNQIFSPLVVNPLMHLVTNFVDQNAQTSIQPSLSTNENKDVSQNYANQFVAADQIPISNVDSSKENTNVAP